MDPFNPFSPLIWAPPVALNAAAALAWVVAAVVTSRGRRTFLQFMAVGMACVSAVGAGRGLLGALGAVQFDTGTALTASAFGLFALGVAGALVRVQYRIEHRRREPVRMGPAAHALR
jgi:hypothetical protein